MFIVVVLLSVIVILICNMFSGGGSRKALRELFYGNYYAEDGIIFETDKPNSKEAFQHCVENNIGIKTALILTKDGKPAIANHENLLKEYGIDANISELSEDDVRENGILMFSDLIKIVNGAVPMIVELKVSTDNELLCRRVADTIISLPYNNIAVASFHTGMMGWFKKNAKNIFRGIISAPAKDFVALPKMERFTTGNLATNSVSRPQFILYRNKPWSLLVKFAFSLGSVKGIWTITNKEEGKNLEAEKEMIISRGFLPDNGHYKDIPERVKSQIEINMEAKEAEKLARAEAKMEYKRQREAEKEERAKAKGKNYKNKEQEKKSSILEECSEDFDEFNIPSQIDSIENYKETENIENDKIEKDIN